MPYTLALSSFLLVMFLFAVVLILDMLDSYKEDKRNDEYRKDICKTLEIQSWEARKQRFAQAGIL